ncbi:YtxH domain-containing protein [Putridiphycobacter roseus]|uniref:YtxH domain-containing protein n=1 Tax=Putridiphycobacter roseus TaxID=2219161 RepID=A0A2W1NSY4_9FLAO|nr:YtxH domain-containing protein [Putridiphycobacter roseus]PZE17788.1 YtxH domain-containing protein [Putridiphycobacter roseus]
MESNTSKVILAAGAGVAMGVIAGILFAPAKGTETRDLLKGKAEEVKDQIKNKVNSFEPADILASLKKRVAEGLVEGKDEVKAALLAEIKALQAEIEKS